MRPIVFLAQGDPLMIRTPPMWGKFGNSLLAFDKASGKRIWQMELPAGATGAMMTYNYMHNGKQFIIVPIGSRTHPAEFVALSLP